MGSEVINCVLNSLNSGVMPGDVNETYICLIPKVKSSQKITEYRPINLCNVIYKIISKLLIDSKVSLQRLLMSPKAPLFRGGSSRIMYWWPSK